MGEIEVQLVADVIVPRPIDKPLTYSIPKNILVKKGSFVRVPFRSKEIEGFVVSVRNRIETDPKELKDILESPINVPVFSDEDLKFFSWIADYYQAPLGEVFYVAFQKTLFNVKKLEKYFSVKEAEKHKEKTNPSPIALTQDQQTALEKIKNAIELKQFDSFLLHGVTGSGKTEVYLRAAAQVLRQGRSTIVLVPEIALTPQLRKRFEEHFDDQVAVLHSGLGQKAKRQFWWDLFHARKKVVVGARSALFAPVKDLGLIIVDEEHEPTYKQEDRLRYNARDLALVRAKLHSAVVVLGSATPSIETYYAAKQGRHKLLTLETRPKDRPMPEVEIIDLKEDRETYYFSSKLLAGLRETLEKKEQAILFVNRKGFANFMVCSDCGDVPKCLNCSVSYTYYQKKRILRCHYCDQTIPAPEACLKCGSKEIDYVGLGTERAEQEIKELFPDARVSRLDADVAENQGRLERILEEFRNQEIDILIGTQIVAKGHDFPNVTFIGILFADVNLHVPDFRSAERTFQLLSQVAGRSGREDKPGKVILQTLIPEHYVIQCAKTHDYRSFYHLEVEQRALFGYPPFSRIAQLQFKDLKEDRARKQAQRIEKILDGLCANSKTVEFLGPTPAAIARVQNQFRWNILLKSEKSTDLNALVKTLRKEGVRYIDVDPVSTL
ncbi:MAG: primosomal protein N' [Bacteriovoracia bacterium]